MGDIGGSGAVAVKRNTPTPKAIIHQRFGSTPSYRIEEVEEITLSECPGLSIRQKAPRLYRCYLEHPEFSVVSEVFKKKKDAEQSAAEKAIEKLGISSTAPIKILTVEETWEELVGRLAYFFSNEFFSTIHPLSGHFRDALQRKGHLNGFVPVSVISLYDPKAINICKCINPEVESNPSLVISLVMVAALRLPDTVSISEEHLSIQRKAPYPHETVSSVNKQSCLLENTKIGAVFVPCSDGQTIEPLSLDISDNYYLDVIAQELGVTDASKVLISRSIGKASSETRLYFCAPKSCLLHLSSQKHAKESVPHKGSFNTRASYFAGQAIYDDAILASIGYTRRSTDLFHEDVSLHTYYRLLINKTPSGVYKLSRDAILAAELPSQFTTRSNWRGFFPREILSTFCRQHRLSEPIFESSPNKENVAKSETYKCEVRVLSKCQDLMIQCLPKESFKKQSDATQNTALKVISWLNVYFKKLDMPLDELTSLGNKFDIQFYPHHFFKEFELCPLMHNYRLSNGTCVSGLLEERVCSTNIEGEDSGISPSSGCLVCICYKVSLVTEGEYMEELLESSDEFEFEIGNGTVITHLETVVTQMSVGQSARFHTELPPQEFILASTNSSTKSLLALSSRGSCTLEYYITLLRVTEPLEDRMEQALFSPPLSKQRVEYALQHIKESGSTSLVDFGCGSGSLLDALSEYHTSLERIIGVDLSHKGLARAAKILHSKLSTNSDAVVANNGIKSATLYYGSITTFDSRLYGVDIGTCLEVIEHMEESEACLFGDIVLTNFCPKILIVSTPNYEYNVILQKSNLQSQEDDVDEKNQGQSCKFRNHDHKFEWTRDQFERWASDLAQRHNYGVVFSGVGGVAGVEPGFASQIAVFRRRDDLSKNVDLAQPYEVIWDCSKTA